MLVKVRGECSGFNFAQYEGYITPYGKAHDVAA
jgi:hypothetical protein